MGAAQVQLKPGRKIGKPAGDRAEFLGRATEYAHDNRLAP
jgi:hypothetical protein